MNNEKPQTNETDRFDTPLDYNEELKSQSPHLKEIGEKAYELFMAAKDGKEGLAAKIANEILTAKDKLIYKNGSIYEGEASLAVEVEKYIREIKREFSVRELDMELNIVTKSDKNNRRKILQRLKDEDIITPLPGRPAWWRFIEAENKVMRWWKAPLNTMDLLLPLGLHEKCNLFNGNIICVAGQKEAGKSAFCLNTAFLNRDKYKVIYINSEMGEQELRYRLTKFNVPEDEWKKIRFIAESKSYVDYIQPGAFNIVDFLELNQERVYQVGNKILEIHEKLNGKGIALVALQLDWGKEIARGGSSSLDKPRLYLSMKYNLGDKERLVKIMTAKNWLGHQNPNGQVLRYKVINGAEFIEVGIWHEDGSDPLDKGWKKW